MCDKTEVIKYDYTVPLSQVGMTDTLRLAKMIIALFYIGHSTNYTQLFRLLQLEETKLICHNETTIIIVMLEKNADNPGMECSACIGMCPRTQARKKGRGIV